MPGYHTTVNGMKGTGNPLVPLGSQSADAEVNASELTGGTYSGMRVSENVKKQIETGNAGDFFYFTPSQEEPGQFDMHAKLPEYGCDGPGKPVFKLRENNNRLMKGVAQKFLNSEGQIDPEKGMRFLLEYQTRFGVSSAPFNPEKPLETNPEVLHEDAVNWLAGEIGVPIEERGDFRNFCNAALGTEREGTKALSASNFLNLWEGFMTNIQIMKDMQANPASPAHNLVPGGEGEGPYQSNLNKQEQVRQELLRIASIEPATEMNMIVPTECSGSTQSGVYFRKLANQARTEMGQETVEYEVPHFFVDIRRQAAEQEKMLNQRLEDLKKEESRLYEVLENGRTPDERNEARQKLSDLEEDRRKTREDIRKLRETVETGERKWDEHHAPVLGSFVGDDGKTYYLTVEAFAPEVNVLADHPAITDQVAIGVYSGQEDFEKYYKKDNAYVKNEGEMRTFIEERRDKIMTASGTVLDYTRETDRAYTRQANQRNALNEDYQATRKRVHEGIYIAYAGEDWQKHYDSSHMKEGYQPTAGSRAGKLNDQNEIDVSNMLHDGLARMDGVPEAQKAQFASFLSLTEKTLNKVAAYGDSLLVHKTMYGDKEGEIEDLTKERNRQIQENPEQAPDPELTEKIRKLQGEQDAIYNKMVAAGPQIVLLDKELITLGTALNCMLKGKDFRIDESFGDEREKPGIFRDLLRREGIDPEQFEAFVNAVGKGMQPPGKVTLDIQAVYPEVADSFLQKTGQTRDVFSLNDREREFAFQNVDVALSAVYTKEMRDGMKQRGEDVFDHIYIDGVSANEAFAGKFDYMEPVRAQELKKAEVMRHILDGAQIDFARQNANGERKIVPLTIVSDVPSVSAIAARVNYSGNPRIDYGAKISEHENELNSRSMANPRADVVLDVNGKVSQELKGFLDSMGQPGTDKAYKAAAGLAVLNQLTGINTAGAMEPDLHLMGAALNHIYINGVPYASSLPEGITKENRESVLADLADRVANSMREERRPDGSFASPSTNHISVLKDGKLEPLTYTPPEPVPPHKARLFASKAEKQRIEQERQRYMADMKRKEHWEARNREAQERCGMYDSLRASTFKPSAVSAPQAAVPAAGSVKEVDFNQVMSKLQRDQKERQKAHLQQIHNVHEAERRRAAQKKAQKGNITAQVK